MELFFELCACIAELMEGILPNDFMADSSMKKSRKVLVFAISLLFVMLIAGWLILDFLLIVGFSSPARPRGFELLVLLWIIATPLLAGGIIACVRESRKTKKKKRSGWYDPYAN